MKLNPAQHAVVTARDPRILVMAGAGTGKTATSVHWVAELVRGGVAPRGSILMITFTRKAAQEMLTRIERLLREVPSRNPQDRIACGTYHAIASLLLRADAEGFGLLNDTFSTVDESECQSIWKSALKQCGLDTKSALFIPQKLHGLYSLSRNTCTPLSEHLEPVVGPKHLKRMLKVARTYEELKRAANVVDYDDLLVLWRDRMQRDPAYAASLRHRWSHVLVDEMQDNNPINGDLLNLLAPRNLLVVGDANQSIYGFRGADVSLIQRFPQQAPTRVLKLESNYRSGQRILDLANQVVAGTPSALVLQSAIEVESTVSYRCFPSTGVEAQHLLKWIKSRTDSGHKPCTTAILARSSKFMTELEVSLNAHRIRYKKYGGQAIADAAEVRDFIAVLRISHNMQDRIALLRALMLFPGIGEGTAAKIIASHEGDLFGDHYWPREARDLPLWVEQLQSTRSLHAKGELLATFLKPLLLTNYPKDGEERLGTIAALVESMKTLDTSLPEFLDGFTLNRSVTEYHPDEAIVLSTIHSSKGLEWDAVWMLGTGSLQMPHPRAVEAREHEEERRLFYVAVTRARRELVLSFPSANERGQSQRPSPFIPEDVKWDFVL